MKKKLILFLCLLGLFVPVSTKAADLSPFKTMNFKEALAEEGIELVNKDYKETDDQAIIYLFRGKGCGFCKKFLTFLSSISKEYGKYFKVVSFEVWNDGKNANLMNKVPEVTNVNAAGVPYVIIGSKVFDGYSETYDSQIKDAIMAQYKDKSYDVFDELVKKGVDLESEVTTIPDNGSNNGTTNNYSNTSSSNSFVGIFWNFIFICVGCAAIIYFNNKNKQEIIEKIDDFNKKNKKLKDTD